MIKKIKKIKKIKYPVPEIKTCRVFKREDGHVYYSWPADNFQGVPNFEGCEFDPITKGLPYIDILEIELPSEVEKDWHKHGPLYFDGEIHKDNLKFDDSWSFFLMPSLIIKRKLIEKIHKIIDEEYKKKDPDIQKIMKLHHECRGYELRKACPHYHELKEEFGYGLHKEDSFWIEKALQGLDLHVSEGNKDKPLIRKKLIEHAQYLKMKQNKKGG